MVNRRLRILALLLAHPGEESLAALAELAREEPWLAPAAAELKECSLESWQAEHTRLFLNGHPRTVAPPFESAYRFGQLDGSAGAELQRLYERAGLGATGLPADYLGTQLEFAAWLLEEGDPEGLLPVLWEEHLALWLPRFCEDLAQGSRLQLYRQLAGELGRLLPLPSHDEPALDTAAS